MVSNESFKRSKPEHQEHVIEGAQRLTSQRLISETPPPSALKWLHLLGTNVEPQELIGGGNIWLVLSDFLLMNFFGLKINQPNI